METPSPLGSSSTTESQRWRITLEYDGAEFAGWQLQPGQPTIQGAVEQALEPLLGHCARVGAAGRTDAGVHAAMQVASFVTSTERTPTAIRNGLNARLPDAIACIDAERVPISFDPRHAPHTKTYRYTWVVGATRRPLRRGRAWRVPEPLDVDAMAEAARCLLGTHDFTSFRASGCTARHAVRTVQDAIVTRASDEVHLRMLGTGFLRHMVRNVAGSLYDVGRGRWSPDWLAEVLAAKDRGRAGRTAPARGLLLEHIDYGDGSG